MNYFFGISNNELKCKLTVPKFQNLQSNPQKKYKLFKAFIYNNLWRIEKLKCEEDNYFYYINNKHIENNVFFFLATKKEIISFQENNYQKLLNLNNFTSTSPSFRANMRIYNSFGGFSSYQSEYPFSMINKNGSILTPISSLTNKKADSNKVFLINIFKKPVNEKFELFFVDINLKKTLYKKEIFTNTINEIKIENKFINYNVFIFTKKYICIPVFVSTKNNHLSCEHTHPPHEYIMSKDRMLKISELKKEVNEIVS